MFKNVLTGLQNSQYLNTPVELFEPGHSVPLWFQRPELCKDGR